jgi:hypothetical protein
MLYIGRKTEGVIRFSFPFYLFEHFVCMLTFTACAGEYRHGLHTGSGFGRTVFLSKIKPYLKPAFLLKQLSNKLVFPSSYFWICVRLPGAVYASAFGLQAVLTVQSRSQHNPSS